MARRSRDWNEGLADDLQDPEFARQFLTAAVEDGVPLKLALAKVIRATGVKEFSQSVGMPSPNVLRAINPKNNPTQETLERLLKPFGLRIGLAQIKQRRKGRAASRLGLLLCPTTRFKKRGFGSCKPELATRPRLRDRISLHKVRKPGEVDRLRNQLLNSL